MSILSKITRGTLIRPQKAVIYAAEGFGKTTLAAHFPDPVFLDTEGSTHQLDVARLAVKKYPDAKDALSELAAGGHGFKTVVIDTIDWLERMAAQHVVEAAKSEKIKGLEDFGYGKGYTFLAEEMVRLLAQTGELLRAGMHVALLAHAKVTKFEPPDAAQGYDRYELKLSKQVAPLVKEWADLILFGNYRTTVRENDSGRTKGIGGKDRVLYTVHSAACDAKNRHRLPEAISIPDDPDAPMPKELRPVFFPATEPVKKAQVKKDEPAKVSAEEPAQEPAKEPAQAPESAGDLSAEVLAAAEARGISGDQILSYLRAKGLIREAETPDLTALQGNFADRVARNIPGFLDAVAKQTAEAN